MMRIGNILALLIIISFTLVLTTSILNPIYTTASNNKDDRYVRCDACHVEEHEELSRTGAHKTMKCISCHTISEFKEDLFTHEATTYECIYCHINVGGKFRHDAHDNFSNASNNSEVFSGMNDMCISCHTQIELEVEWYKYKGMNLTVDFGKNGESYINFTPEGTNRTLNYTNKTK